MKTIKVAFTTCDFNSPEHLVNVASLEDIEKILNVAKVLTPFYNEVFSVAIDVVLFDLPEDSEFRYDVAYVRCYIGVNGEVSAYQYFQSKWDAATQIESESIDLEELKEYLTK